MSNENWRKSQWLGWKSHSAKEVAWRFSMLSGQCSWSHVHRYKCSQETLQWINVLHSNTDGEVFVGVVMVLVCLAKDVGLAAESWWPIVGISELLLHFEDLERVDLAHPLPFTPSALLLRKGATDQIWNVRSKNESQDKSYGIKFWGSMFVNLILSSKYHCNITIPLQFPEITAHILWKPWTNFLHHQKHALQPPCIFLGLNPPRAVGLWWSHAKTCKLQSRGGCSARGILVSSFLHPQVTKSSG